MTATTPSISQLAAPPTMQQREGWLAHTWRLTEWTLYTMRRRALSKWLAGIFLGLFALTHGFVVLLYVAASSSPRVQQSGAAIAVLGPLTFPTSLSFAGGFVGSLGVLCIVILAGAAVGGEYGAGTVRIWLSRGVGRAQMLVAQTLALALIAVVGTAAMLALGALVGVTLGPLLGGNVSGLPDGGGVAQLAGYWLAVSSQAFAYGLLALFLATLTRSTPAGIGIPLGYMLLENIAIGILTAVGEGLKLGGSPEVGNFIASIPSWLLGGNVSALVARVADGLFTTGASSGATSGQSPLQPAQMDLTHALVFVLGYCAVFAVGSWLVLRRRDITD